MIKLRNLPAIGLAVLLPLAPLRAQSAPEGAPPEASCRTLLSSEYGDLTGPAADWARTAELVGVAPLRSRLIRRASQERELDVCGDSASALWARHLDEAPVPVGFAAAAVPVRLTLRENGAYPNDRNDGALWAGRGIAAALTSGALVRWGTVSAAFVPRLILQENRNVEIVDVVRPAGHSPWIYPWHPGKIDWPQRFGDRAFWTFDPGQSHLRLDTRGVAAGLSTENLWWGPALRNPLLLSNTAPGFPHLFLGTSRPVESRIGEVEGQVIWGRLSESPYFDGDVRNGHRLLAGFVVNLQPRWLPGLYLGAARLTVTTVPPDGLSPGDYLFGPVRRVPADPLGGGDTPAYELVSLFGRWAFPEAGFEAYGEWARPGLRDVLWEPDLGQAYVLGFQKVAVLGPRWIRVYGELAHLTGSPTLPRDGGGVSFYTHPGVPQGHTHRGQLLGAAIGPGSDAQILGADLFFDWGRIGVFGERVRRDDDAYYAVWTRYYAARAHDLELTAGVRQLLFLHDFDLGWSIAYGSRDNRGFLGLDGYNWHFRDETNWSIGVDVSWRARTRRPPAPRPPVISADGIGN